MVQLPGFPRRIEMPPSTGNAALDNWLRQLSGYVNSMPRVSWFSGTHPNLSKQTGTAGDMAINLASGSTNSRLWVMGGAPSYSTTSGWVVVNVTAVP